MVKNPFSFISASVVSFGGSSLLLMSPYQFWVLIFLPILDSMLISVTGTLVTQQLPYVSEASHHLIHLLAQCMVYPMLLLLTVHSLTNFLTSFGPLIKNLLSNILSHITVIPKALLFSTVLAASLQRSLPLLKPNLIICCNLVLSTLHPVAGLRLSTWSLSLTMGTGNPAVTIML